MILFFIRNFDLFLSNSGMCVVGLRMVTKTVRRLNGPTERHRNRENNRYCTNIEWCERALLHGVHGVLNSGSHCTENGNEC